MIAGKKYIGTQVDMWSCGIILFALICGFLPFEDPDTTELYKKILIGKFSIPGFISQEARDLLKQILVGDPEKRYKPADIRAHTWFQSKHTPVCEEKGIFVGFSHMLYEEQILSELEQKGFQRDKTVRYLDANKHNHETTCYYLILKKLEREGKVDAKKYYNGQNMVKYDDDKSKTDIQKKDDMDNLMIK